MKDTMREQPFDDSYDVIVVGARCAGAATAMLLARAGLSVLAVDRAGLGADTLSTHALTKPGVLQLSRWGVLDAIRETDTPRVNTVAYHYADHLVEVPIRPHGDVDGLYAPRRMVLDRVLADAATAAGAQVRHSTTVNDLLFDDERRVRGVVLGAKSRPKEVHSSVVIGADGVRSLVARRTGAAIEHRAAASSACIYTYAAGLPDDVYRTYMLPGLAAGVIPTNGGMANVWVSVTTERFEREARRDSATFLRQRLAEADPRVAQHLPPGGDLRIRRFAGLAGFTRQAWGAGWTLVGDAVYFKDPISAHGMTDALIGAELLARAVIDRFDTGDEQAALGAYAEERAALAAPMMGAIAHLTSFAWPPSEAQQSHLEMNQAMRREWDFLSALGPVRLGPWAPEQALS